MLATTKMLVQEINVELIRLYNPRKSQGEEIQVSMKEKKWTKLWYLSEIR